MKKILLLTVLITFISCGEDKSSKSDLKKTSLMEGFWERVGTVQIVNGVSVDTIFWSELEEKNRPIQVKDVVCTVCWRSLTSTRTVSDDEHPLT